MMRTSIKMIGPVHRQLGAPSIAHPLCSPRRGSRRGEDRVRLREVWFSRSL